MARLSAATRAKMPAGKFAGPGKSFPINDPLHARLAISGATRSQRAGNISPSTAASIKSKARAKLGDSDDRTHNSDRESEGGCAVHSSMAGANMTGREPQHTSKTR